VSDEFQLLVLGGGPTGFSTAGSYREAGGGGAVAIVTDEGRMPYNRPPLTKELLRGESSEDELPLAAEEWLSEQQVSLISGRAVSIDNGARTVSLSGGRQLGYGSCVLATGAEPKRLPVPGADDPAVRVVRTIADLRELLRRLAPSDPVAVIGSGFIGCEIASSLRLRGHAVTLVSDEQAPNQARLGPDPANEIRRWLEEDGVELLLGTGVQRIERSQGAGLAGAGLVVRAGIARARGALVVMAAGVAPRGELAAAAGLELTDEGAVPVDSSMATGREGLLAAGDVCKAMNDTAGRPLRVEHWGDALGQGSVAGRTAAGQEASWSEVPGFWSTVGKRMLKYAAWGDGFDQVHMERSSDGAFTAWYGKDGLLAGVLTHHSDQDYERGKSLIAEGAPWSY
jgi:3-phenylpropionate/trans-cinnamate dioxygenase ferredoxin reductase component